MKRMMAVILMLSLLSALFCGCGTKESEPATKEPAQAGSTIEGKREETLRIATITGYGDVNDMYYNQTVYEAMVQWCKSSGADHRCFESEEDSTQGRVAAIELAIAEGYQVLLLPDYSFAGAIVECAPQYPDVRFLGLDIGKGELLEAAVGNAGEMYDYNPDNWNLKDYMELDNVYCCTYRVEIAGYMAGYAAVKMGYTELGFVGAMAVPAIIRYSYGFIQGAEEAAKQTGVQVNIKHGYGYYGCENKAAEQWYNEGTQVIFACGGGIWTMVAESAMAAGGEVIGVDVDMADIIESFYEPGMTVTSAMKDLAATTTMLLDASAWRYAGNWDAYRGKIETLGMPYLALPESTQWNESFTKQDYETLRQALMDGTLMVSDDISCEPVTEHITVEYLGSIT